MLRVVIAVADSTAPDRHDAHLRWQSSVQITQEPSGVVELTQGDQHITLDAVDLQLTAHHLLDLALDAERSGDDLLEVIERGGL